MRKLAVLLLALFSFAGTSHAQAAKLQVAAQAPHSVMLTWNAGTCVPVPPATACWTPVGYNVFRGTASGAEGSTPINAVLVPITTLSYVDLSVQAGQTYFYTVESFSGPSTTPANQSSSPSNEAIATTPPVSSGITGTIMRTVNGTKSTIVATYTDPTLGVQTVYQLWGDAAANHLLTSGRNTGNTGSPYTITWSGNKVGNDAAILTVTDSAGGIYSSVPSVNPPPACWLSNPTTWENMSITPQSATFTVSFVATPSQLASDSVIGVSAGPVSTYAGVSAMVAFTNANLIEAWNGTIGNYASATPLNYVAGVAYTISMVINPAAGTYNVLVTPAGGAQVTLATGYTFRAPATTLNNVGQLSDVGTLTVCNLTT